MIVQVAYAVCDLCQRKCREAPDHLAACLRADGAGWRTISTDPYGGAAHFCRACAAGKTDGELLGKLGLLLSEDAE